MPTEPLQTKQYFQSFDEVKAVIEDWAVTDKFEICVHSRERNFVDWRCKTTSTSMHSRVRGVGIGCPWRVFATSRGQISGEIKIG